MDENKIREQYDAEIKTLKLQRDYLLKKTKVLNKCRKDAEDGNVDLEELNSLLCYNESPEPLAFCCRPKTSDGGKNCMWRDTVLNILHISKDDFIRTKEESASVFYSKIRKKE